MDKELNRTNGLLDTAFENISPIDYDAVITELQERVRKAEKVICHVKGLSFGVDWNKGTAAGFHREKLLKALEDYNN